MKIKKMIIISVCVILLGFLVVCCMPEPEIPGSSSLFPGEVLETGSETGSGVETGSGTGTSTGTGTGTGSNSAVTDESFFYDSVVAEGNVWMRTSGGLSYDSPTAYKKFFSAAGSVKGFTIKPNAGGEGYCIYDIGLEYKTHPDLSVNSGFSGGTIVFNPNETLDFAIDKTAKTITVTAKSKPGESVVFTLQENAE